MYMTARKDIKGKVPTSDKEADKPSSPPSIKSYATPNKHQQTPRENHCNQSSTPPSPSNPNKLWCSFHPVLITKDCRTKACKCRMCAGRS
ncbi:hypothetical protein Bpfe_013670 [Biomphalaria pfeifferi]|uniref:Uncharacterized protein n=1 Tax=Biomphalaria pfeifferi TaxID=112525 RepID=A0AAD8FAT9_BIOPF|nr:hypothetical protein Bpfe_013670 [Biomphalaria pfeifferi]